MLLEGSLSGMIWPLPDTTARQLASTAKIYPSVRIAPTVKHLVMEEDTFIGDFCLITVPELKLGDRSQVNSGTRIVGKSPVYIKSEVTVSYGCTLISTSDSTEARFMNDATPLAGRELRDGIIDVSKRVFIGAHSVIMPNVIIEEGIVIRAFSYVNKSLLNKDAIYMGQPAKLVGYRSYVPDV